MKLRVFKHLPFAALLAVILLFDQWLKSIPSRREGPADWVEVHFEPASLERERFMPLRLAGGWKVEVNDPRFGGVSALAVDGDWLLALTDSGTTVRLPRPGSGTLAFVKDLPSGPGSPRYKSGRDSEALARDPAGRGWWVAFEHWHQLWLYDHRFDRALGMVDLGKKSWPANRGVEAMVATKDSLFAFPESGREWVRVAGGRRSSGRIASRFGFMADAAILPDGRLLFVTRRPGLAGLAKRLAALDQKAGAWHLRELARIGLGATDNVEALAVERRAGGGTRLWLMTDNDFRPRKATMLLALDLP